MMYNAHMSQPDRTLPSYGSESERPLLAERTEDLSDEEVLNLYEPSAFDDQVIKLLIDGIPRLLVGSRGTGKSMLLRYANAKLAREQQHRCLGVYVNFSDYLMLDPLRFSSEDAPAVFRGWVTTKILAALLSDKRLSKYRGSLSVPSTLPQTLPALLEEMRTSLAKVRREALSPKASQPKVAASVSDDLKHSTDWVVQLIRSIAEAVGCRRVVLLFDEAGHTFSPSYQVEFFRYFRALRADFIAAKAAVYPGSTAFGPSFDVGHDAKIIPLDRDEQSSKYLPFMKGLLKRRLVDADWDRLCRHEDLLDVLLFAASGNPRAVVSMADRLLEDETNVGSMHRRTYKEAVEWYSNEVLWPLHRKLGERVPSLRADVELGRDLIDSLIVPDLSKLNARSASQTPYFALAQGLPAAIARALSLLQYAGIVVPRGSPRRGRGQPLDRYLLNLSICINQRVLFGSQGAVFPVEASQIANLLLANYKQYQAAEEFTKLVNKHPPSMPPCSRCGRPRVSPDVKFCGYCGAPLIEQSAFNDIVGMPISSLDLSERIKARLQGAGFSTVGDVLRDEEGRQIRKIKWIKTVRFERIRAAAMEQFSA